MSFAKHVRTMGIAAVSALGLLSCSIPKPECTVGQTSTPSIGLNFAGLAAFSVRYILKSGTGECANFKGEVVGFQSYHPDKGDKTRDFSKTFVAVRTQSLGELQWMTEDLGAPGDVVKPNAIGTFAATDPDAQDMCTVPTFEPAQVIFNETVFPSDANLYPLADDTLGDCMADTDCNANVNAVCLGADPTTDPPTAGACAVAQECMVTDDCNAVSGADCFGADATTDPPTPGACYVPVTLPKTDLKYEWSNVKFYVTAAATGTQFMADVKITLNGCEATYTAVGMWPAIDCTPFQVTDPNDTTGAACGGEMDAPCPDGSACDADSKCHKLLDVTGEDLCNPDPDVNRGRPIGSGINPDFGPVVCDTEIAVVPVVDQWYSLPDVAAAPLSVPRCALNADKVPSLEGFKSSTSTASQ